MTTELSLNILLVEDDDVDAMAFERHVGRSSLCVDIHRAVDGVDALETLRSRPFDPEVPFVIFLDLNMPRMNGTEFLSALRDDAEYRNTLVFVLTTSEADSDLRTSYDKNIAGYVLKSRVGERFEHIVNLLGVYRQAVEFPPVPAA